MHSSYLPSLLLAAAIGFANGVNYNGKEMPDCPGWFVQKGQPENDYCCITNQRPAAISLTNIPTSGPDNCYAKVPVTASDFGERVSSASNAFYSKTGSVQSAPATATASATKADQTGSGHSATAVVENGAARDFASAGALALGMAAWFV
ncbi:hypothetical protein HRG_011744 [Hirsutella rhossiliensis]|uniref:Uncharacterized protein n=1 Tax=Hirsutella rhossiliensis TaxID=111463 RepID=A0A9P8MLE2_9HYPO|nr:uncharacterized protein HRG_11744 [Hirsutella rhossiliensis]KAH0957195.1 hypothetical protein HRG_11744 [Hirsutella rhossiliensis]